jgi:glycosyltransferase involved in cell wall biosynthesis
MGGHLIKGNNKISVVIPCSYKHAPYLYSLLEFYECQTQLPDEVVISLSEIQRVSDNLQEQIKKQQWAFPVKLITTNAKKYAGDNRNIACSHAQGDIFVCQDADDLPHPQRLEIISFFFTTQPVNQVLHSWLNEKDFINDFNYYTISSVSHVLPTSYQHIWSFRVHFGNVAITKEVFKIIKWTSNPRGQDVIFNKMVMDRFKKCLIIRVPLLVYRAKLSTNKIKKLWDTLKKRGISKRYKVEVINYDLEGNKEDFNEEVFLGCPCPA